MNWFKNLSVQLKVLSVASLGIIIFMAYFAYSYLVANDNIEGLTKIESVDFVVLEASNQNNLTLYMVRNALERAINSADEKALADATRLARQATSNLNSMADVDKSIATEVARLVQDFDAYFSAGQQLAARVIAGNAEEDLSRSLSELAWQREQFESAQAQFQASRYSAFYDKLRRTREDTANTQLIGLFFAGSGIVLLALISFRVTQTIVQPIQYAAKVAGHIAEGDWDREIRTDSRDEAGRLLTAIRRMRDTLKTRRDKDQREEQIKSRLAELNERMRGDMTLQHLGENMLNYLVPTLDCQIGAFYCFEIGRASCRERV